MSRAPTPENAPFRLVKAKLADFGRAAPSAWCKTSTPPVRTTNFF